VNFDARYRTKRVVDTGLKPTVVLADDYRPITEKAAELLAPRFNVLATASNGEEALDLATELNPDFLLLDIAMPRPDGMQVARALKLRGSNTTIVFLTGQQDSVYVEEALAAGAKGYVLKQHLQSHLLAALEYVLAGYTFVSTRDRSPQACCSLDENSPRHAVQIYSEDGVLLNSLSRYVKATLSAGDAAVICATKAHRDALAKRLESDGVEIAPLMEKGRYVALDAAEALAAISRDGMPDKTLFSEVVGEVIRRTLRALTSEHPRVVVFGELVALLLSDGRHEAVIHLERIWSDWIQKHPFFVRCGYPAHLLEAEETTQFLSTLCLGHSAVLSRS
jgi:CheY-like chemotaxis protein